MLSSSRCFYFSLNSPKNVAPSCLHIVQVKHITTKKKTQTPTNIDNPGKYVAFSNIGSPTVSVYLRDCPPAPKVRLRIYYASPDGTNDCTLNHTFSGKANPNYIVGEAFVVGGRIIQSYSKKKEIKRIQSTMMLVEEEP